ncbi:centrosomal protein of 57 kDa isoform 2-T2 [Anableps anableps]
MEILSKTPSADSSRHKASRPAPAPSRIVSDSLSLPSYKAYPAHRAFINTLVHQTRTQYSYRPASPSKAFPESSSAAILSALRNLQEKIQRLEFEKEHAEPNLCTVGKDGRHKRQQSESTAQRLLHDEKDTEGKTSDQSNCNQGLITHLAAAETRCEKLERQLEQMRKMLRSTKTEKTSLPNQQMKISDLERKLQEEEYQRRLIQDKANQLQTGLEANRILLQSVSPCLSIRHSKEKKSSSKRSSTQYTEPHYRLSLKDVPFVTGTSVACSHSVRANVQAVLSLLKQHQPHLCNRHVLSHHTNHSEISSHSDRSSTSSTCGEELSELLQALQEELHLLSLELGNLMRQVEDSVSEEERKELQMEQERLLLRMERKGEQISKLCKHKSQMRKFRKEAKSRKNIRTEERPATRGRSAASTKAQRGERSKNNLRLLKDMRTLQASLCN